MCYPLTAGALAQLCVVREMASTWLLFFCERSSSSSLHSSCTVFSSLLRFASHHHHRLPFTVFCYHRDRPLFAPTCMASVRTSITVNPSFSYLPLYILEQTKTTSLLMRLHCSLVTRPFVKSELHLGNQMPLNIRRALPC